MDNRTATTQKKKLGVAELTCYGIGNCVGSGIFVSLCSSIGYAGYSIVPALLVSNLVVLFAYAYKTLMAGAFVLPGGNYSQSALLQPPLLVGVTAISTLFNGLAFAMYALSIVDYAAVIFPEILPYRQIAAFIIITFFFATTILGGNFMGKFNLIMVGVLVVSLLTYIAVGMPQVDYSTLVPKEGYFRNGASGFIMAVAMMSFACQGATLPVSMTPDAKDPKRSIPKAILYASGIVTVVYTLIAIVTSGILPIDEVANKNLGVVAAEVFPYPVFVIFILGGACFAIATSLYGTIASVQHPLLATVDDGWLPAALGKKTKRGYPWLLMLTLYIAGIIPIWIDMGLDALISLMMIPTMILNLINNILMVKLLNKYPDVWKAGFFRLSKRATYVVLVLAVLSSALICVALLTTLKAGDQYFIIGMVIFLFGFSYYRLKAGKVNLLDLERIRQEAEAEADNSVRQDHVQM